jgi:hypothetical protein
MPFGILTVLAFGNVHAIFGVLVLLDLGMLAPLVIAWRGIVVVAFCERQHERLIVALESLRSSLAFVCCCHRSSRHDKK